MKYFKLLFLFFLISCSSSKVIYDYDETTSFTQYKTFDFFEDAGKGLSQLDIKRVVNEVTKSLKSKGMVMSNTPDMYINIISKKKALTSRSSVGIGLGTGGRNVGFGISGGIPIGSKKINEELLIDFVDGKTNQLIWQGISENQLKENASPDDKRVYYGKVIIKMLSNYPPKK